MHRYTHRSALCSSVWDLHCAPLLEGGPAGYPDAATLVKRFRLRAGLTQAALAETAGLSARAVQDVERGLSIPRPRTVRRLIAVLDVHGVDREQLEAAASPRPRRSSQPG